MKVIRSRNRLALFLGVAAVVALVAAGAAYALTSSSFKYSSPKTGYVRVSNMAFAPDGFGSGYSNAWSSGLSSASDDCLNAGVDLPVGSKVKAVTFYYKSGAGSNFIGEIDRKTLGSSGIAKTIAHANPSNNAGTPTSVSVNVALADQAVKAGHAFGMGVCPGSDGTFYGAKVKYTYTSAGS